MVFELNSWPSMWRRDAITGLSVVHYNGKHICTCPPGSDCPHGPPMMPPSCPSGPHSPPMYHGRHRITAATNTSQPPRMHHAPHRHAPGPTCVSLAHQTMPCACHHWCATHASCPPLARPGPRHASHATAHTSLAPFMRPGSPLLRASQMTRWIFQASSSFASVLQSPRAASPSHLSL